MAPPNKAKSTKSIKKIVPPPPPPDDSTATTATTIAESSVAESAVAESSVADTSTAATTVADPNNNANTIVESIASVPSFAPSVAPDLNKRPAPPPPVPRSQDETFDAQRKLGYLSTTGMYGDVLYYNNTRSDYIRKNNMDKVRVVDAAWAEKVKQDKLAVRKWPPKSLFLKTYFWTCGHYGYCANKWARSQGLYIPTEQPSQVMMDEPKTEEKRLSKSTEVKRFSKSGETKRLSKTEEDTTKVTKTKSSKRIGGAKSAAAVAVTEETNATNLLVTTKVTKQKSTRKIGKDNEEVAPERGRRSVEDAAQLAVPVATPTPSSVIPETPLKVNNFSTHRLHVANIPLNTKLEDVQKLFKGGTVDFYADPAGTQMLATVKYENVKAAHKGFQSSKKLKIGGKPLVVAPKLREDT